MKKTMKRWLAMLLAVLMVMGTLPTSAWAARRDEEFAEQPVISDGDGVTDTLGRHDEGEFPVDPVDPSDPPADLNAAITSITLANKTVTNLTGTIATGTGTGQDQLAILILPRFTTVSGDSSSTVSTHESSKPGDFANRFVNGTENDAQKQLNAFSGMPYIWLRTGSITYGGTVSVDWPDNTGNWGITANGSGVTAADTKTGVAFTMDKLAEYATSKTFYEPDSTTTIDPAKDGLPFTVFIGGSSGFSHDIMRIKVTTQPLKVEIQTKDALTKTAFSYAQAGASTSTRLNGEQLFTEVKLTNSTTEDMNVRVTISRDKVTSVNTNYGNKTNITEETTRTIAEQLVAEGLTAPTTGAKYTIDKLYGLLENWNSDVNTNNVVPPLQNGDTATTITVTVPKNGGTKTIYVAGTQNSALTGGTTAETNKNYGNGLGGFKKGTANYYNFWSSYEIEAECTTDSSITGADHAGIRWEQSPEIEPKVRLVYGEGENKGQPITDRTGQGLDIYNNDNDSADKLHSVVIQGITIPWDETAQCYKLPTGKTVVIGQTVRVDGVVTNQKAVSTENGYIDVPMYQVTVDDDPDGKANNGTKDVLGHYMWDTTVPDADAGGSSVKKVSYTYYPENASVGVYAKKDGFSNWGNATNGALTNPAGSSLEITGDSATTVGGHLTVNSDVAVIAHYMKPITLVTTFGGKKPGDNAAGGDSGNRDVDNEYVFNIEVRDITNAVVASYTKDGGDPTKITAQTLTNAWLLDLDAGKYRLYINGRPVRAQFNTDDLPQDDPNYNFVIELAGVTPKVKDTNKAGSTLVLPDDLNPNRARGDVTVTGVKPNADEAIKLYYPTESSVKVTGAIAEGDTLSGLTYDGTAKTTKVTDSAWGVDSTGNNMSFNISGTKDLVVTFGAATGKVEVTFLKDTLAYVDATREVKLSTASDSLTNAVALTAGTADGTKHIYTNDAVDPAKATNGVFYVFVGGTYVNETVTVTAGATDPATATVNYYTLTVEADQTKDAGAKVEQSTSAITGDATKDRQTAVYLKNTVVNIKATKSGTNYAFSTWEVQDSKGSKPNPDEATTSVTMTTETHLKAIFTKPKYDTYLKVTLNTNTNVTDELVSSSDTDKDFVSVTLGTGAGAITATHVGNGVWKAAGVVDATQKDLQWYVTTRAGGPFTANQSAVADRDDPTKFAEIKLYSVSTEDTDYDTAQATMTATGVTGQTRVIVEKGAEITLSVTAATGYDHASPYWKEGTAGKGTVEKAKYTLTTELTAEQTLTPTFTYKATITPTVGTSDTVCDVNTVVLTAKDATNTNTTVGTPTKITAEGADKGKWTVTGLTIGTEYAIWVNGHKSDKTVAATAEVKVPMWTVSVATTTGGTVALTTTSKLSTTMPNGATYAGWTITATKSNGYRLGDAAGKVWKLTTGNTIGALSDDEAAAPTLSVPNPITGNVVATAYFTQQWTVKSTVDSDKVNSTAKLTDADSGDGTKDSPSTKTIDNTTYVKVDFNRSAGETLDGWTLSNGGAGKWYVGTTPDAEGATWTDWATTAPTKAVESFYFKPSADSTITAAVKTKPYPVTITVLKDGEPYTGLDVELREGSNVHQTTESATTGGTYTVEVEAGKTYTVYTNGLAGSGDPEATSVTISFTVEQAEAAIKEDATAEQKAVLTREVKYWTVTLAAADHGKEAFATSAPSTDATTRTKVVLDGGSVNIAANPDTNYKFSGWTSSNADAAKGTFGSAVTTAVNTYTTIKATTTLTPSFEQKTGTVTVTVKLDGQKDDKSTTDIHTVTLYQGSTVVGTAQTGKSGSYSFTNVPYNEGGTKYHVTVVKSDAVTGAQTYTALKDTANADIIFSGNDGGTKTVDAPYFTAIAATEGNGNASINFGGDDGTTKKTDYTDNSKKSVSFVVASGTQVTWQAHEDKANYTFDKWTEDNSTAAKRENVAVTSANKTFTAKFKKDAFNTYLYLTVNGDPYGETATDGTKDIQSVELVTAKTTTATAVVDLDGNAITPTYDDTTKVWKAEGVKSEGQNAYWRVKTVDGGVYFKDANTEDKNNDVALDLANNKAVVREPLFGVVIERGAGNDTTATYTPTLQAQTGSEAKTRIVTEAEVAATVDLNKKSGYTWSKWLSKQSASPANTDDLDTTNHGKSTTTTTADGTFALVKGYTAPATGVDKDLHIKPVYTFTTTIVTKYKTDPTDVTKVEINDGTTTTTVNKETAGTGDHTGRYTASGLDPEKTYTIIVNGFPSTVTFDKDDAGEDVDVTIFKVTVEQEDKKDNTLTPDGKAYVKLGANATGASATSVYLPIGATTTTGETDETKVNLTAAVGDTNPVFRLYNKDNAATDNYDEILWNAAFTAPAGKTMTAAIATNTGTQTPNNLTIGGDDGMQADVTVTAYFLRQYDLTVSAVKEDKTTAATSKVNVTEKQGLGTSDLPANAAQSVTMSKVDEQTYVKVEFQKAVGETFIGWDFTAADGKLYTGVKDGAVDPDTEVAPAAAATNTATTVYFVPAKDGATLKAVVKAATYNVKVTVKLDNTEYKNENLKVELRGSDGKTIELFDEKDGNQTGVFTIPESVVTKASPEVTYKIYVNGVDLDATLGDNDYTEIAKDIYFTAKQAEGIKADGNPATTDEEKKELQANLEKTINYYTVNLKADPAGTDPTQNKISFAAITGSNTGKTTDSKIFLAKAAGYDIDIYSKVYAGRGTTDTVHYRFVDWTETATTYGFVNKDAEATKYHFKDENTLVADTTNIDGTQDGKQLTLTANFKEQYKVTVKLGTGLASNAFGVQIKNEGDTNWASDAFVYVDKGNSAVINGKSNDGGVENSDSYLSEWTIEGDASTDFGAYDNSYLAGTNDTAAAVTRTGYQIQNGKYTPKQDSVLVLNGWQKPLLDSGWVFDKGTGAETSTTPYGERTSLWTKRDAQETPSKVKVKGVTDTSYSKDDLTENTEYTRSTDKTEFTFDVEQYLKDLPNGTYALVFEYTLGGEDHPNKATREVTNTTNFIIKANKNKLTDVNIQVKDHPNETANPVAATTRNAVEYVPPHQAEKIDYADLTFTWYWSANDPGNTAETAYSDDADGTKSAADKANAAAAAKGVLVSTLAIAPTVSDWTKDGDTVKNGVTSVTDSMKGGYLFAVVTTPDGSEVSTGAVITNAIPVDYDAKITLRQDGDPVTDAKADGYAVYLWPADETAAFDVTSNKAVQATHVTGAGNDGVNTGIYSTKGSKLNANTSYHIYVLETEGMTQNATTNYIQWKNGGNPVVISRTTTPPTYVDYYTVSVTDMSAGSTFTHATTAKQANDPAAAETFTSYPTFTVTTPKGATINNAANAKGVLKGTTIGVKANALEDKTVGWDQDYTLAWQDKEGAETAFSDAASKLTQSSTTAVSTGYAYTTSLANKVDFTGRLTQNTYTLTGIIRDVNNTGSPSGGKVASATLTKGEGDAAVTFNHKSITQSGFNNGVVSFTVPRGTYKLNSVEASGSTHKGHWNGGADTSVTNPLAHLKDAVEGEVTLAELTAQTPNATVANQFTIYVAATLRQTQLKDTDKTEHDTKPVSRTDQAVRVTHTVKTDDGHKIVFNYDAFDKEVIVKNTGNTPLKLKSVLKSKTLTANDVDASYTPVALTNGADTNGVTFKYTHKIAADGTETAETTPVNLTTDTNGEGAEFTLQPGEARKVTIHITDKLENADDVTYRLDFTSVDGRPVEAPATPAAGPTVGYVLNIEIEPVTIGRVTTWNDDGTFRVQDHWLKEDAIRNGATEANLNDYYSANTPKNHNWAAETLKADSKKTTMDDLVKQGDPLEGGGTADSDPANSDIKYRWYVGDPDATVRFKDKTTGELECTNGKILTEVNADAGTNGKAYTPTTNDHGKMLYLVAVGQRNATNAVMTPDKDTFHEDPVPIPYPATITLYENWVESDGTVKREQVKEADKGNYTVWLWDVTGGKTDELDTTNTARAIEAEAVAGEDGTYKTDVVLYPDHEYQVWTSAAKTADGTAFYLRNTGITIASVDQKAKDVNYYLVDVADTELSQNTYATELADANIVDNSQYFYKTTDLTGDLKKPVAKMPDKGAATATLDVTSNYVLNNTEVTFGFGDRDLDYDLNWGGGMTAVTDKPTDTVSHKLTYKDEAKAAVTTELELRLYDVDAYVVGQGVVSRVTMTMVDGENKYTFVTDTDGYTAGANETVLLGMKGGTAVTSINTGGNATFRLPKYTGGGGYETIASHDAAYTLSGYYAKHGDSSTLHDPVAAPGEDDYAPFHKGITAADAYDIVLQGDSYDMRVTDNVNTGTKKDTSGASAKYGDGLYDQNKTDGGQKNTDGTVNQSITLNYNYGVEQNIKLTVTNETKQPELPNDPLSIYDVTFTEKKAEGGIKVSDTATNDFAGGSVDEMGRKDATDATKGTRELTLTIPDNLAVGRYEYQAEFTYLSQDGVANTGAKVTYNLVVIVEPLTFNSVDITKNDDGTLIIDPAAAKQYTVTRKVTAEDGENPVLIYRDLPNTTPTDPDTNGKLTQDTDYGYQWISAPVSMSYDDVKAAVSWSNGALNVTEAANGVKKGSGADATQKAYMPKAADSGRNLFLVIYGKDNATGTRRNATYFAVSPAQVNTYKGMVALTVDGAKKRDQADATSKDNVEGAGYEVWFVSKDNATVKKQATWTKVGDEYAYVADLTPNTNGYSVEISRAKDSDKKVALTGATIDGTKVVTTIDPENGSNVVEAPFFTVNAVNFINEPYKTGTGETFTATITPTITIGDDHAELANHTPVLSGQSVAAKADKAWTQDYTLTWRNTTGNNENITTDNGTNLTDATNNAYKGQSATDAIADGAYAYGMVSAKTFIGGRLDQTTYTIVGTIHGPTGNAKQVKNVTLTSNTTPAVIYYSDINTATAGQTGIKSGAWTKDNGNNGLGNNGDEVTFTVVKGTYTVTGYEDATFTIRKVTVEGTDVQSTPRNQKIFTKDVKELDAEKRIFDIYLEATGPKLTVNDADTATITATSTPDDDHQFADNNNGAHYYYKQLDNDGVFTLELSNPGNVDLKLKAPEVYKLDTGTDYSDSTKLQAALTAATTSQVTITNGNGTDVVDTNRTILTFAGLPAANDDVKVGESVSHDGTELANAGTITVSKDVYNKDDAIYVVKFASEYLTTDGAPAVPGPTVYYVLDLQVEPLPIKKVTAETDPTKTDGTLRLKDFVASGGNDNDGLNSVEVDHDRNAETALKGAKDAGLVDADISYVWYSAPTTATVVAGDFDFDTIGMKLTAQGTAKGLKLGTQTNNGKTYKPTDAEQGLNFYLVAYRTDATKNASEFAVSDAVYAQVTIAMKAYRTGKVNKSDTEATPLLTEVNISTMVGEDKKISNNDTVTVTGVADNANVLTFNATKTDVTATGAVDDPAAAKWYFKSWAVKPLTGDELDATDTSIVTPVDGERLTMNYTATGKATVIGYFDKLPELSGSSGCTIGSAPIPETSRTLDYKHHDGSGNIQIWVMPKPDEAGTNKFKATGVEGEDLTSPRLLNATAFEKIAGSATGSMGGDGAYVLLDSWVKGTLEGDMDYIFTFYDMDEGAKAENGYAGYDRSHNYATSTGDKSVTAVVADGNKGQGHTVQVTNTSTDPTKPDGAIAETSTAQTNDAVVTLHANPKDGYAFVGWTVTEGDGTFQDADGKGNTRPVTVFRPRTLNVTVTATFRKGDFTPAENMKTSVYYGDDELQETDGKLVVSVTKDTDTTVTQNFSYALATEAELTTYLNGAARPANAYTTDGKPGGDGNPNTNVVPAWLDCAVDATDNTKVNFTVKANTPATGVNVQKTTGEDGKLKDVEDELVVYLKVTETHTGESKIVPVTIDVMTSKLKIRTAGTQANETTLDGKTQAEFDGANYKTKFVAVYGSTAGVNADPTKVDQDLNEILHGSAVEAVMFEFLKIDNEKNANDVFINEATNPAVNTAEGDTDAKDGTFENKGKWSWTPLNHTGAGNSKPTNSNTYTFTFTYDTGKDEEKWNYEGESIEIKLPVLRPKRSLLIADKVKNYADVKTVLVPGGDDDYSTIKTAGEVGAAPVELDYTTDTFRKNESITYLDTEPVYTALFQRTGVINNIKLTVEPEDGKETVGFEVPTQAQLDAIAASLTSTDDVKEATLDLTVTAVHDKVWVGEHYIRFHLTGKDDQGDDVDAYYTLSLTIDPRLITAVDVTTEYNKTEPTDVTPTIEGDPTLNDKGEDTKGNTPIKDATVTWETEDAKNPVPVKETVTVEIDPNYKIVPDDIKPETELNGKNDKDTPEETGKNPDPNTVVTPEAPAEDKTDGGKITITQLHPILMFNDQKEGDDNSKAGPAVNHVRHLTSVKVGSDPTALGKVLIDLGAYSSDVYDVDVEVKFNDFAANGGVLTPALPEGQLLWPQIDMIAKDGKTRYVMDLTGLDTSKAMNYVLRLEAKGTEKDGGAQTILASYELHLRVTPNSPPPSGPSEPACPCKVFYHVGLHGVTTDATVEDVSESNRPSKIPTVTALDGYAFRGWSLTNPATLKKGEKIELVDPKTVAVKGDAMTFYAVIVERPFHEHYVIGYPNGNFGPADNINRASVATIIARAILPDFVEGANYGNPGGYSDVSGHWAESAIAYCSKFDVFKGYTDGTFRPDQPITRQEFATVIARLDGELTAKDIPFNDIDEAGDWALNGIYTSYEKGWVNGYTDGTFKPLNNIRRDEAVKVFNAYLNRGVDADGLADLREYVHTGAASNNTENGVDEYMTWPDVPKGHWAYYEIVEAANDHEFTPDFDAELGYTLPEHWEKCWIDERWRYGDGPSGGDSAAMVSAGFQVWLH